MPGKTVKDLKRGEWFTLKDIAEPKASQVFIRGEYDRVMKKYECDRWDDVGSYRMLKGSTPVYTEFTF